MKAEQPHNRRAKERAKQHAQNNGQTVQPEPEPWDRPIPLGADLAVPAFPVAQLPGWLAEWVAAVAEETQTPPDMAAVLAMAVIGAGVARKVRVEVRPGWQEPLNIFGVVALPPGDRKSNV